MLRVLALGAGVQSSTVALMMAHGELETVDYAIFADTEWEPKRVYEWLDYLEPKLPFPVLRVRGRRLWDPSATERGGKYGWTTTPMYTADGGMLKRQCTADWKIEPITRKIRELLGAKPGRRVPKGEGAEEVFGISLDEATRMKDSRYPWLTHRYPLVWDKRMTRQGCLAWMEAKGYPQPPRSACVFCPFKSDREWKALEPDEWAAAVEFERSKLAGTGPQNQPAYLHAQRVPLPEVDLSGAEGRGLQSLWDSECEGMCGV